jgi:CRISPR-associated protein Cmr1
MIFECETVTPMFLAGADGATPELRPPSIKGMMRFWWRALNGHLDIDELKKNEAKKFGASDEKIGKSKINIRILSNISAIDEYFVLPHKKTFKSKGISPNQRISIALSCYDNIGEYSNILRLSLLLGGIGKRVRRGFGSIRILNIDKEPYDVDYKIEDILKLINIIGANIYTIEKNKILLKKNIAQDYPFVKEIQLGHEYGSWNDLLEKIGVASHKCKNDSLGFAHDGKRLSSPVYVSVLKNSNNKYLPIITTLNTVFKNKAPINFDRQVNFKEMIL